MKISEEKVGTLKMGGRAIRDEKFFRTSPGDTAQAARFWRKHGKSVVFYLQFPSILKYKVPFYLEKNLSVHTNSSTA